MTGTCTVAEFFAKVHKATTNYDNWFIRQMLRGVETICAVTEFVPADEPFLNTVMLYQVLMADHEEEILNHLKALDSTDHDIAKACTLFPYHQAIHKLDNKNKLTEHQFVPEMFADVIVALATQTTAEDKTAQRSSFFFFIFWLLNSHFNAKPVCFVFKVPWSMRLPFKWHLHMKMTTRA